MVRTRFAPSPTGFLHIGAIRTVLYCLAMARKNNGKFIVRVEDTDRNRYVPESVDQIFEILRLYGLEPNESIKHGGDFGPYMQSERLELYQERAHELVEKGFAYYCFLTPEETKSLQDEFMKQNKRFRSPYRDASYKESLERVNNGEKYVVRLRVPEDREITYTDGVQGTMKFHTDEVSENILLKQDGFPTYHLAVAIDDHAMKISHVFRGFEWIPSIPVQVLTYEAFGWNMPQHYHLSVILDPEGGKLSKRKGNTAANAFLEAGYLPEAINNFVMLLGWSAPIEREHGEKENELFSLEEFIQMFDVKDLNKSNPVFDDKKLEWFNKKYIINLDISEFKGRLIKWIELYDSENELANIVNEDPGLEKKLKLIQERSKTLKDAFESIHFFYVVPKDIDWKIKQLKRVKDKIQDIKAEVKNAIEGLDDDTLNWAHEEWEQSMRAIGDEIDVKHGDIFMVLRVSVCGQPFSPPLFETLQILGKKEVLKRLK